MLTNTQEMGKVAMAVRGPVTCFRQLFQTDIINGSVGGCCNLIMHVEHAFFGAALFAKLT